MDKIHIVIHPQSIVHSLVEFEDGSMLAQLSMQMRLPIQYALTFSGSTAGAARPLELEEIQNEVFTPDFRRTPSVFGVGGGTSGRGVAGGFQRGQRGGGESLSTGSRSRDVTLCRRVMGQF